MGQGDSDYYLQEPGRLALLSHLAEDPVGHPLDQAAVLDYLERDANFLGKNRDTSAQPYGLPNHNNNKGRRWTPRDLVKDTVSKTPKLTLALESLATKILFDNSTSSAPRAVGVEYLAGAGVYGASWQYNASTAPKRNPKASLRSQGSHHQRRRLQLPATPPAQRDRQRHPTPIPRHPRHSRPPRRRREPP